MAEAAAPAADAEAAPIFKRKNNASNIRKRNRDADEAPEEPKVTEPESTSADAAPDRPGRQKKDPSIFSTKDLKATDEKHIRSAFAYSASNTAMSISDQKVFAQNIIDGDDETKATALKRQQELKEGDVITDPDDPRLKDGKSTYRGLAAYSSHIEKKPSSVKAGPVQGGSNIRITSRFDYQPDLCKDYKETGYCCFGDSCKFMHDRGDYKSGWQLEKEWEKQQYGKANLENYEVQPEPEDDLPFACHLCREPFTNPVVTKCEHYFCESCALENYKKNNKCPVCNAPTQGIFNVAHKLIAKMKQRKRDRTSGDAN